MEFLLILFALRNNQNISKMEAKIDDLEQKIEQNQPRLNFDDEDVEDLI